jgi:S-adenosylmethionine-diacylglycerol 3-amino-3-carboxypropyl transferase
MSARADATRSIWVDGSLGRASRGGAPRILFGQVREDADVEVSLLRELPHARRIVAIASGGCTAFALAAAAPRGAMVVAVDVNPAQIHLCELKLALLRRLDHAEALAAIDHDARLAFPRVEAELSPDARRFWSARQPSLSRGLNGCGAVDRRLRLARGLLHAAIVSRRTCVELLGESDPAAQARRFGASWDGWRWRSAFRLLLSRPLLRGVYGRAVVEALPRGLADHVRARVERSLVASPARSNPYAWQTFLGRYAGADDGSLPAYLRRASVAELRARQVDVRLVVADVVKWLDRQPARSCDFLALSNVLEIASGSFTSGLSAALLHAAAPGAFVVVRSLLPTPPHDLRGAGCEFDAAASARLTALDRSGVCADVRAYRARA